MPILPDGTIYEAAPVLNNCLYCKREITEPTFVDIFTEDGPSRIFVPHYCSRCIKQCGECKQLKGVWAFPYLEHVSLPGPDGSWRATYHNTQGMCTLCARTEDYRETQRKLASPHIQQNLFAMLQGRERAQQRS
jgi:hypothetical protein